jgi:hypothetical protein
VDDACAVRLCDHCVLGAARLVSGNAGNFHSASGMDSLLSFGVGWNSRDHHFAVSVFLAGGAGSRGRPGAGQNDGTLTAGFNGQRIVCRHERCINRHVTFEPRHVLHHLDDGGHAERARDEKYRNGAAGRRSPTSSGGPGRILALYPRIGRNRNVGSTDLGWILRLHHSRGSALAVGIVKQ